MEILFLGVGLILGGGISWFYLKLTHKTQEDDSSKFNKKINDLEKDLDVVEKEKNELVGKNKQLFADKLQLTADLKSAREKITEKDKLISDFEAEKTRKEKEFESLVKNLDKAKEKLEEEQIRIRREDEEKIAKEQIERDRIWNDHENFAVLKLKEVCQKQDIGFQFYDNTSLPPDFDGKLKPDFLVEFLDQYIIFDAKKSKDPKTYIRTQVKETAKKISGYSNIYKVVFFVMPLDEILELKELYYFEDGASFHVISLEAVEPILRNFKKVSEYEKIQDFDPQDRENIVNLVASYDQHISLQNAVNIVLTRNSMKLIKHDDNLSDDLIEEVNVKKKTMGVGKVPQADVKRLAQNLEKQGKETEKLTTEKPPIDSENLDDAENLLSF